MLPLSLPAWRPPNHRSMAILTDINQEPENPTILEIALVKTGSGKAQIQAVAKDLPDILLFPYSHETLNALLVSFLSGKPMKMKVEKQKRHV
jgi:hypothetical protein